MVSGLHNPEAMFNLGTPDGLDPYFAGNVYELRVYDSPLGLDQIKTINFWREEVPEKVCASAPEGQQLFLTCRKPNRVISSFSYALMGYSYNLFGSNCLNASSNTFVCELDVSTSTSIQNCIGSESFTPFTLLPSFFRVNSLPFSIPHHIVLGNSFCFISVNPAVLGDPGCPAGPGLVVTLYASFDCNTVPTLALASPTPIPTPTPLTYPPSMPPTPSDSSPTTSNSPSLSSTEPLDPSPSALTSAPSGLSSLPSSSPDLTSPSFQSNPPSTPSARTPSSKISTPLPVSAASPFFSHGVLHILLIINAIYLF